MMGDVEKIAKGLSESERAVILRWDDFHIGKWLLRRMGVFPARHQGKTVLGAAFCTYLMEKTDV